MKRFGFFTINLAVVAILSSFSIAHAEEPMLIGAWLYTQTLDDNKDCDTGVYIYVYQKDSNFQVASIDNAANSSSDSTEYNDWSQNWIQLRIAQPSPKSDWNSYVARMFSRANGNDKWKFNATVYLAFSDGTWLTIQSGDTQLNSRHSRFAEINF
jgi:hypothetical protein